MTDQAMALTFEHLHAELHEYADHLVARSARRSGRQTERLRAEIVGRFGPVRSFSDVRRFRLMVRRIARLRQAFWRTEAREIEKHLSGQVDHIMAGSAAIVAGMLIGPSADEVAGMWQRPIDGRPFSEWVTVLAVAEARRIETRLWRAAQAGEDAEMAVRQILRERQQLIDLTGLVAMAATNLSTQTFGLIVTKNQQIFSQHERFVAVVDKNTTDLCEGLDGQIFPVGVGPSPPLHYGCRSGRFPVVLERGGGDRTG